MAYWIVRQLKFSLLSLLFLPPMICMAQAPQYTQVYSNPMTDITPNIKGGLNAWVATSGTCKIGSGVVDPTGNYWCISPDTYVYELADGSTSYVKQTAMGTGVKAMAILGDGNIFALMSGSLCTNQAPDMQVYEWNSAGSSWTAKAGCLSSFTGTVDNFLAGITKNSNYNGYLWSSTNEATSWQQWSTGWSYINMWASAIGCAINTGGGLYEVSTTNPVVSITNPTGVTPVGCIALPMDGDTYFVWDAAGHVYMNDDGSWHQISGLAAKQIDAVSMSTVFAMNASGVVYHLNFQAGSLTGTTTGNLAQFPGMNPQGAPQHTIKIQVTHPHNLSGTGTMQTETVPYNQTVNFGSTSINPMCDLGLDFGNAECTAQVGGSENCNQVGALPLTPTNGDVAMKFLSRGRYIRNGWDTWTDPPQQLSDGHWNIWVHIPVVLNCAYGTPTCPLPHVITTGVWDLRFAAGSKTLPVAESLASVVPSTGPWVTKAVYLKQLGQPPYGCVQLDVKHDLTGGPCD